MTAACMSFGLNGFDTIFLSIAAAFGFIMGALSMRDIELIKTERETNDL